MIIFHGAVGRDIFLKPCNFTWFTAKTDNFGKIVSNMVMIFTYFTFSLLIKLCISLSLSPCECLCRCHAVNVYDNNEYVYNKINEDLREGGLDVRAEDIIDVIGGYHVPGYGISSNEDLGECLLILPTKSTSRSM